MDDAKKRVFRTEQPQTFPKILPTPLIIDMEQAKSRKINTDQAFDPLWEVQKVVK